VGKWKDGKKHGQGTGISASGDKYADCTARLKKQ